MVCRASLQDKLPDLHTEIEKQLLSFNTRKVFQRNFHFPSWNEFQERKKNPLILSSYLRWHRPRSQRNHQRCTSQFVFGRREEPRCRSRTRPWCRWTRWLRSLLHCTHPSLRTGRNRAGGALLAGRREEEDRLERNFNLERKICALFSNIKEDILYNHIWMISLTITYKK